MRGLTWALTYLQALAEKRSHKTQPAVHQRQLVCFSTSCSTGALLKRTRLSMSGRGVRRSKKLTASSEDAAAARLLTGKPSASTCAAESCTNPILDAYSRRSHLCSPCRGVPSLHFRGANVRFCVRCHSCHPLDFFDGTARGASLRYCRRSSAALTRGGCAPTSRVPRAAEHLQRAPPRQAQAGSCIALHPLT